MSFSTYKCDGLEIEYTGELDIKTWGCFDDGYKCIEISGSKKPQSLKIINHSQLIRFNHMVIDGFEYFGDNEIKIGDSGYRTVALQFHSCSFVSESLITIESPSFPQRVSFSYCSGNGKLLINGNVHLRFGITTPLDISDLDTSNITSMSQMFEGCENFNQDISKWDVSNVTNMNSMFDGCENFNQDISKWDVSNVTDMRFMFDGCKNFNQDISKWDVSNVISVHYMFKGCKNFNQDISGWDVSNVISVHDIYSMFHKCPIQYKFKPKKTKPYDRVIKQLNEVEEVGPHPDDCGICSDGLHTEVKITLPRTENNCGHTFHAGCLIAWKDTGRDCCPLCRTGFPGEVAFHRGDVSVMSKL